MMWWFLGGLFMLFAATMVGYVTVRVQRLDRFPIGTISDLPWPLLLSTIVVLAASVTIQLAVNAVRREQQGKLRRYVLWTLVLGLLFVAIQTPCMVALLASHWHEVVSPELSNTIGAVYRLIFALILIHALHVLGGLVHLIVVTRGAFLGRYDHEWHNPVKHAAMYWHFLDAVWIVMFGTILILR